MSVAIGNIDGWQRNQRDLQYEKELRDVGDDARDLYRGTVMPLGEPLGGRLEIRIPKILFQTWKTKDVPEQ